MTAVEKKASDLFQGGASVNSVAKELGITWAAAKKLQPGTALEVKRKSDEPEDWDLTVVVPAAKLDVLLAACTAQEKANALQSVLQMRMDSLLA